MDADEVRPWTDRLPPHWVADAARQVIDAYRSSIIDDDHRPRCSPAQLAAQVAALLAERARPNVRTVINATGIILHTGLGRAPMAKAAVDAAAEAAGHYAAVEVDLQTGQRGSRIHAVHDLLCELTGAEMAAVVNNNAAATVLTLAVLAGHDRPKHKVIVSRGELIEIGGSFRLPQIMQTSGAELCEVGTTNKTRLTDYEAAVDEQTAGLMKVHPSNYRVTGFTDDVSIGELVELARRCGLPVVHDIGSGAMFDFARFGLGDEPIASQSIAAGADLVLFSGDKLLGGPQGGVVVGRRAWVEPIARHPLMRAMRVDKMTLAALEATLRLLLDQPRAMKQLPLLRMLTASIDDLRRRADQVIQKVAARGVPRSLQVRPTTAFLGGGSMPTEGIVSVAVCIEGGDAVDEEAVARRLRLSDPPVMPRVHEAAVWLDMRTVFAEQDEALADAIATALIE